MLCVAEGVTNSVAADLAAAFAGLAELGAEACVNLMANLCDRIVRSAQAIVGEAELQRAEGIDELAQRLLPKLESHCRHTLQGL